MKKIELKGKKHWDVTARVSDLLVVGAVLSASGTDWDFVETTLSRGESVVTSIRVYSGKRKAAKLQHLLNGMSEVGCFEGCIAYEMYPHR